MRPSFEREPGRADVADRLLDRLVDGELSENEYRRLLESFEETPGGWRRCALAFLEHQALQREFMSPAVPAAAPAATAPAGRAGATAVSPVSVIPRTRTALRWLAVAASWIALFGAGWLWSAQRQEARFAPTAAAPHFHSPVATEVPLAAGNATGVRTEERPLQSEFIEQLRQRGHDWRLRDHYIPVELEDGKKLVVPVRELQVSPVRKVPY